ncbi:MAG: aminodeoxychorismate synthase component I [Rhizobiales bacterium]|nr:aminodeoxychorismate synthase component I [Hyphomicrobiales bacterium]
MTPQRPFVVIDNSLSGRARIYRQPELLIRADRPEDVSPAFRQMEDARRAGLTLAGYASYELGYAFEARLGPLLPGERQVPLLCFGAFRSAENLDPGSIAGEGSIASLMADWSFEDYSPRFGKVLEHISAGDVYQINLTFPMRGRIAGDPLALYRTLRSRQPVAHGGVVALGEETVLSLSPELFFAVQAGRITAKPMKGTARRDGDPASDRNAALLLAVDEKQRAENLMIVDLLRNDLSRISRIGSVHVPKLFEVETYPTLHQMTSTVAAELLPDLDLYALFAGLFPCGSVTGAPKIRAMEIIRAIETMPRGVYCGAVGWIAPWGDMSFNVAIRTLTCFADGSAVFNVGSGIVADSTAMTEYDECLLKSRFLSPA